MTRVKLGGALRHRATHHAEMRDCPTRRRCFQAASIANAVWLDYRLVVSLRIAEAFLCEPEIVVR
jgi:hypothetical protein